jgi:hypothetical protein
VDFSKCGGSSEWTTRAHRSARQSSAKGRSVATSALPLLPLFTACEVECLSGWLVIPPTPGLKVCGFCHGERRRKARKEVAVILAIGHALRTHKALGCPDALSGFLKVVHRLIENGVFVGHEKSIRVDSILRWVDGPGLSGSGPTRGIGGMH